MEEGGPKPSAADIYAAQKSNIRDTAKWMATAYAAVAAVIVAGAPFSGLSALTGDKLVLAIVFGVFALASVLLAINDILSFLIGDYAFVSDLPVDVRDFINEHADDVLPPPFSDYDSFKKYRKDLQADVRASWNELRDPGFQGKVPDEKKILLLKHDALIAAYEDCETNSAKLVGLAHLRILQDKLKDLRRRLAICTLIAVLSLAVCVWALPRAKPEGGHAATDAARMISTGVAHVAGTKRQALSFFSTTPTPG